jgi:hypothetical protein
LPKLRALRAASQMGKAKAVEEDAVMEEAPEKKSKKSTT